LPDDTQTEQRVESVESLMPAVWRAGLTDLVDLVLVIGLGAFAVVAAFAMTSPWPVAVAVIVLEVVSFSGIYRRIMARPDHVRALQSDRILAIANESLQFLRQGLDEATAEAVCGIVLRESEASAVAITGRDSVLGFAGLGQDHHLVGGPIITRATHEALDFDESRILHSKDEIGCPEPACKLNAAIVVPLEQRGEPVGTLKFYYTSDRRLNETQLAMAEGLARLLSTQLELAELERQTDLAREMELKALQAQINPHFLFNTINTIAAFIRTDPTEARRLLRQFGTFYRRTLETGDELVTVQRELEYVGSYLELEQARFGEKLVLHIDVSADVLDRPLPAFMLQPLVENAVGHGMRPDGSQLTITITGRLEGDTVVLAVADDGRGITPARLARIYEPSTSVGLGIALGNVRDRLRGHFGTESTFEIESVEGVGTTVTLRIAG